MGGLVAVVVASHQAFFGDVFGVLEELGGQLHDEEGIQIGYELRIATHGLYETIHIVRHIERIDPGVAFHEALALGVEEAERRLPSAVGVTRTGEAYDSVEGVAPAFGTTGKTICRLRVAHHLGGLADGPVVVGILQGGRDASSVGVERHVAEAVVGVEVTVIGQGGAASHGLEQLGRGLHRALGHGVGEDRHGVVADHAPVLVAHVRPYGQGAVDALLAVLQHALHHVGVALGLQQVEERMQGTVGVPEREHRVVGEAFGLVDVVVETTVLAVDIHIDGGVDHGMVERGVEHGFLVVGTLGLDDGELTAPFVLRLGKQLLEAFALGFGLEVAQGALGADGGERHFHLQGLGLVEGEVGYDLAPRHLGEVLVDLELAPHAVIFRLLQVAVAVVGYGLAEADGEVGVVGSRPSVGDAVARQQGVVFHAQVGPQRLAVVVVDAVLQVEDDVAVHVLRVLVLMYADMFRSRQPYLDAVVVEGHAVVARGGRLAVVRVAGAVAGIGVSLRAGVEAYLACGGHDENVAEVGVAGSAEVGVAEADDGTVFMLVTSTILIYSRLINAIDVVRHSVGIGTELHDAERRAGSGEGVPHAVGADDGVDVWQRVVGRDR